MALSLTVIFVTLTIHLTWRDNSRGLTRVRASDLIKVLVQFLQYLMILSGTIAPWPQFLKSLFAACASVFGAASGQVLSMDYWLAYYVHAQQTPLSVQRLIVSLAAPVALLAGVVLLKLLRRLISTVCMRFRCARSHFKLGRATRLSRQLPVVVIVVLYFVYPMLLKAALGFFSCVRIEDASQGPYAQYAVANHSAGYWVHNTTQECFAGWREVWALSLGLPAVLLLCVGVPVGLLMLLSMNRAKAADAQFRERFGFLYRHYTDSKMWWEAVWASQTVLLTAVAVFQYYIKAYYTIVVLMIMFLGIAVLQSVARPWAEPWLHRLQPAGSACLLLTAYCTLTLFTVYGYEASSDALPVHHTIVAVVLIVLNGSYVLFSLGVIVAAAVGPLRVVHRCGGSCCCGCCCGFCLKRLQPFGNMPSHRMACSSSRTALPPSHSLLTASKCPTVGLKGSPPEFVPAV
jgi:hypothetical protein